MKHLFLLTAALFQMVLTVPLKALETNSSGTNPAGIECPSSPISLEVNAATDGRPLKHFWNSCVGAGRANEGLRSTWQEQMKLVHDQCGFRYVRFHGLFHDDMFVYHLEKDGKPAYNWQYVDDLFDRLLAMGVRPFVEFGFNPIDPLKPEILSEKEKKTTIPGQPPRKDWLGTFWWKGNATPPSDNAKWCALVEAFLRHCIARYGIDEVRQWYFEVWNEPNLDIFFHGGTKEKYFALYKETAETVKKVDPSLRIGGPATSNFQIVVHPGDVSLKVASAKASQVEALDWRPIWLEDFLAYCAAKKLPLDFVSSHPYPKDFPIDPLVGKKFRINRGAGATKSDLALLRKLVDTSAYPKAEIQLTEWSSSPSSRDFSHDCLPAAAFVVKSNLDAAGLVDALSYWTFTDVFEEKGAGETVFHGGFGLLNYQGIVKPTYHAYRFLNALGDQVLSKADGVIVTRHGDSGKITALVYAYPPEEQYSLPMTESMQEAEAEMAVGRVRPLNLTLTGLSPHAQVRLSTLDKTHGNAVAAWKAMGSPEPPTREQVASLRKAALALKEEILQADASGKLVLKREIDPWSLTLIETK